FMPYHFLDANGFSWRVQPDVLAIDTVIKDHSAFAGQTDCHLLKLFMRMESSSYARLSIKQVINSFNIERNVFTTFYWYQLPSFIATNRKFQHFHKAHFAFSCNKDN